MPNSLPTPLSRTSTAPKPASESRRSRSMNSQLATRTLDWRGDGGDLQSTVPRTIESMIELPSRRYRLGYDYRDTGSVTNPADQFLGWINLPGSGMRNMGGIRPLKFITIDETVPAAIILVTDERSAGS